MSLSKFEKEHLVAGGAVAVLATALGVYALMKGQQQNVDLEEPLEERLLSAQRMPITIKTKFNEKRLQSLSHDSNLTQDQIIDTLSDVELLAKV